MPKPLQTMLRAIANQQCDLGIVETSKNQGDGIAKFWAATTYPNGYNDRQPWCAAFLCWVFRESMQKLTDSGTKFTFTRPQSASVFAWESWCLAQDNSVILKKIPAHNRTKIQAGDIVIFSFSHIGIADTDEDSSGNFVCLEGNTDRAGSREGGRIMRKARHKSRVRSLIQITL